MKRSRIKPVSDKRRKVNADRRELIKDIIKERGPLCEAQIPIVCTGLASDAHEVLTRARAGSDKWLLTPENILLLCRQCHTFITENDAWSKENGFLISWSVNIMADLEAAFRARCRFIEEQ